MSMYADWDLVYGLTYKALNRKLARVFYAQRSRKHRLKQVVALALDPQRTGIRPGYTARIVRPGTYEPGKVPTLEVSFFDPQLQRQQHGATSPGATAGLDGSGRLSTITLAPAPPEVLFYPPGIEVRRHPGDANAGSPDNAVVLTGLNVNPRPLATAGPVQLRQVLADWLADDQPGGDSRLLSVLNRYFTRNKATADFNRARVAARQFVLAQSDATPFATCCGDLLQYLVANVWPRERRWKSSYLQVLSAYDAPDAKVTELQALYAYAMKLRNTAPTKAISKSTDSAVLRAAIRPVYEYYRDSETAQLRREVIFRVQEAMVGVEFDFATHTLAETTLAAPLANDTPVLTAVVQALLEAFACLEPSVMPDLLFGVRGLGTGAEAFALRLGPWQIRDGNGPNTFQLQVPVLGGYYYQQATGELQVLNDVHTRQLAAEYMTEFFEKTYKDPGYQRLSTDFGAISYITFGSSSEVSNPLAPATGYPYTGHALSGLLDSPEPQAFLQNRPAPAADPAQHGYGFAYSYTPLFATFAVLSDLPVAQDHLYANMSWAKVTEYRFVFWTNTALAGTLTGQLYVCGSIQPEGSTTQAPPTQGGELNTIGPGNDSFLYVSRALLAPNIFLPGLLKTFRKKTKDAWTETKTADFYIVGNEIKNKVAVGLPYYELKSFLSDQEKNTFRKTLKIEDNELFVIPAEALTFGADNGKLRLTFDSMTYKEVVTLTSLEYTFTYRFVRRHGIARYQLTGQQKIGEMLVDYHTGWYYVDQWGTNLAAASTVLFGIGMGAYNWYSTNRGLRAMVPAGHEHPDRHEIDRIIDFLARSGAPPPVRIAFAPQPDDSALGPMLRADRTVKRDPEDGQVVDRRRHGGAIVRPRSYRVASQEDRELEQTAAKFGGYVYRYLRREVNERDALCFCNAVPLDLPAPVDPNNPLEDPRPRTFEHRISLRLQQIEKDGFQKRVDVLLIDSRYRPATDRQPAALYDTRRAVLTYSYPYNDVNKLAYLDARQHNPDVAVDYELVTDLSAYYVTEASLANGMETVQERRDFGRVLLRKLRGEFQDELWRTMLRTAHMRAQADDRWLTLGVNLGSVVGMAAPWALVIWNKWWQGREDAQVGLKAIFSNQFIESLLRSQLDLLKYPYDEHFTVNEVVLDQDGLKVRMGATTSESLVFGKGLAQQQSVSTYINVHDLTAITLSVAELQDPAFNAKPSAGSVEFRIQFAHAKAPVVDVTAADGAVSPEVYAAVGTAVGFTLTAAPKAEGQGFEWTLALSGAATSTAAPTLTVPLASFGNIDGANVLLVTGPADAFWQADERNTVAVEWE